MGGTTSPGSKREAKTMTYYSLATTATIGTFGTRKRPVSNHSGMADLRIGTSAFEANVLLGTAAWGFEGGEGRGRKVGEWPVTVIDSGRMLPGSFPRRSEPMVDALRMTTMRRG